jgi:hypothetical protein
MPLVGGVSDADCPAALVMQRCVLLSLHTPYVLFYFTVASSRRILLAVEQSLSQFFFERGTGFQYGLKFCFT